MCTRQVKGFFSQKSTCQAYELSLLVPLFPLYTPPNLSVRLSQKQDTIPIFTESQIRNIRAFSASRALLTRWFVRLTCLDLYFVQVGL